MPTVSFLSFAFIFSNVGGFFVLLNVATGIMLHCAPVSNLKVQC